jgi:hypothetical protein
MDRKFIKPIEDRFMRGLISGFIAGTLKDIPDFFLADLLKIKHLAFWDYAGEMILNRIPKVFIDHILAFLTEVTFSLGLGIIYALLIIPKFPTRHYLIRGTIYGCACWFTLMSVIKLFHITPLFAWDILTPLLTLLFSGGYGMLLAYLDNFFAPSIKNPIYN